MQKGYGAAKKVMMLGIDGMAHGKEYLQSCLNHQLCLHLSPGSPKYHLLSCISQPL